LLFDRLTHANTLNDTSIIINVRNDNATRNTISAIFSSFSAFSSSFVFIDRKERKQLSMRQTLAAAVPSSMIVAALNLEILIEVMIIRQKPSRLVEVFKICGDFL
jgi:hypothetical protein